MSFNSSTETLELLITRPECIGSEMNFGKFVGFIITLIYSIPSLILYFLILKMIFTQWSSGLFHSAFYKIFILNAFMSVISFLVDLLFMRFLGMGVFCEFIMENFGVTSPSPWLNPIYFLNYYSTFAVIFFSTFLCLNRLTTVMFPTEYRKLWSYLLPLSSLCSLLLPALCVWHLLFSSVFFMPMGDGTLVLNYKKKLPWLRNSQISTFVSGVCGVIMAVSTLLTIILLRKIGGTQRRSEKDLLLVGFAMAISVEAYAVNQVLIVFMQDVNDDIFDICYRIRPYLGDLLTLGSPWFLLFLSRNVRGHIFAMTGKNPPPTPSRSIAITVVGNNMPQSPRRTVAVTVVGKNPSPSASRSVAITVIRKV